MQDGGREGVRRAGGLALGEQVGGGGDHGRRGGGAGAEEVYYENQGGWNGNTWGGVTRCRFVFSDSLQVGEGRIYGWSKAEASNVCSAAWLAKHLPNEYFAGIVCVAN